MTAASTGTIRKVGIGVGVFVVVAIAVCVIYGMHMVHRGFSTRTPPSNAEATMAMSMRDAAIPARYKDMKNPLTSTPQIVHDGMAHYADHCAICHANNGSGETMFGRTMYPRPPNIAGEDTQSMSDGELYYTIENGVRLSGMPAFGEGGDDDQDTWKLVAFLRHLPKLTEAEQIEMSNLNPKAPDEKQEDKQEDNFLNGGSSTETPTTTAKGNHHEM